MLKLISSSSQEVSSLSKELTRNQVEQAFQWLDSPNLLSPPAELNHLDEWEWLALQRLLSQLYQEKKLHRLQ